MKLLHFLLLIPLIAFTSDRYSIGPVPDWVIPCEFDLNPPLKPSQVDDQCLLIESQDHLEAATFYRHQVVKILTKDGLEDFGQLIFEFDPKFEEFVMHKIQIYRSGVWSDRLKTADFKLLQREEDLEAGVFDGSLTAVYLLEDLREGDIIEFAFSLYGQHPFLSEFYSKIKDFQYLDSIEKIFRRVLAPSSRPLYIKNFNSSLEPKVRDLSPSLREWIWQVQNTEPLEIEDNEPDWYDISAEIQITQAENWHQIIQTELPFYLLPNDVSPQILDLVAEWKAKTPDPLERALLAVRFVQDEIRYFSKSEGIGGQKPRDPSMTLEQRFGDCKDKSFLLHALLKLLDISSTPILVHSIRGDRLAQLLPMCFAFNHAVLRITIGSTDYFIDPTISLQGGSLSEAFFPDYKWGLPISETSTDLILLPQPVQKYPTEVFENFTFISPDMAELKYNYIFYGLKADINRRTIHRKGLKKMEEKNLKALQRGYGKVTQTSPLTMTDDRQANILTMTTSYLLPAQSRKGSKTLKIYGIVKDHQITHVSLERHAPLDLQYPLWIQEHISIHNPFHLWEKESEAFDVEHDSLRYRYSKQAEGEDMKIDYELQHLKDHIPVESLQDYWDSAQEIEELSIKSITFTPKNN